METPKWCVLKKSWAKAVSFQMLDQEKFTEITGNRSSVPDEDNLCTIWICLKMERTAFPKRKMLANVLILRKSSY